ncbi:MAG TPA: YihY/virulence factor BrkB family protein, partial [Solimonas sp.]|nr:YihY/virulence factor BrkB family protein [Solimonas sp.]
DQLWDLEAVKRYPRYVVTAARYAFVIGRDLMDGQLNMRAMGLVYTSLLSLVPMLALAFSVLKALGVHNSLEPVLLNLLGPLGAQSRELSANIIGFVEKVDVKVLGAFGLALLFYAAISMIHKVEDSFNFTWRIERPRPLSQRLGEYLAVLTVGPVLVFSALGVMTTALNSDFVMSVASVQPFGIVIYLLTKALPYALIIALFTFLYRFVPNARVRLRPALGGGLLAGILWQASSALFASFVATATNYNAIYSGFAIMIFLLIWLYVGWLILLVGCLLSFYVQNPQHLKPHKAPPLLSGKQTEFLALMIMSLTGRRFLAGETGYTLEQLWTVLNAPQEHVLRVVESLIFHGLLTESGQDRTTLTPAMDLESIALARRWRLARAGNEPLPKAQDELAVQVMHLIDGAELLVEEQTGRMSLRDWLTRKAEPAVTEGRGR